MISRLHNGYHALLRGLVLAISAGAGAGILVMMCVTCADVILRIFGRPIKGTFDIVSIAGAITIACALPYTTAVKGHVAIEFFFLKLSRRGRTILDTITRSCTIILFATLSWHSLLFGISLHKAGQVSPTLGIPIFWVPWVIAFSCAVVMFVIYYNMRHPGKEMIKP